MFASKAGTPINYHNLYSRHWKPLLRRADLPYTTRLHDLRHTTATLLLEENVNPLVISQNLGHSDVGYTLRTYTHLGDEVCARAVRVMN